MERQYDISGFVNVLTIEAATLKIVEQEKRRRKAMHITQKALSTRSGVSYASIRRFESTGEISLSSLIQIASALNCLEDFLELFKRIPVTNVRDL